MRGIKTVWDKEVARIFRDRKMIFSVFVLPVAMMIGIMALMNYMGSNMADDIEQHQSIVYVENGETRFEEFANSADIKISVIRDEKIRWQAEKEIKEGNADLIVEFPQGFQEAIANYQEGDVILQVKTFFNPSEPYSAAAEEKIGEILEQYRQQLLQERIGNIDNVTIFTVNTDNPQMIIQDEKKASGQALGGLLPYFITLLLFAGAMGIGTDMIAGEKERGTMASLLMSPVDRSSIALGKVFALMTLSGLSSAISVVAMVIFMPLMSGQSDGSEALKVSLSASQILMLAGLIIAVAFLYSTIIVFLSVFAKDVKEASSYVMPVYMLVLVVGLMTMFQMGEPKESVFFIPIYNSAIVLGRILSGEVTTRQYIVTLVMTVGISMALIGMIVKAFNSEKVMSA